MKKTIYLNTIQNVKDLVDLTMRVPGDVTVSCGRYVVDGKSIMGILSLPLMDPIDVRYEETTPAAYNLSDFLKTLEVK